METDGTLTSERTLRRGLSPSRAEDFLSCPLKFRYRVIDRLPEPTSPSATRGTLVHSILERLFEQSPGDRTVAHAQDLVAPCWDELKAEDPRVHELFENPEQEAAWLATVPNLLDGYFSLEDPRTVEPAERELRLETPLDSGLTLTGILDRLDIAADGRIRIVDYKTGKAPSERYADRALAQMKFYALVVWRLRGTIPTLLQLYYLTDRAVLSYEPTEADLLLTERRIEAIWKAIETAIDRQVFSPSPGPLCRFCHHRDHCPETGGILLPFPTVVVE